MTQENIVRQIRESAGLSQSDFARAIGRSIQRVRDYEHGHQPPADVVERLKSFAAEHGAGHLAVALVHAWEVKRLIGPGETLISAARGSKHQDLHDRLELVLHSGIKAAIDQVVPNLIAWSDYVAQQKTSAKPRKRG